MVLQFVLGAKRLSSNFPKMLQSSEILGHSNIKNQFPDLKKISERAWMQLSTYQPITKKYPTYLQIWDDWHSQESNTFIDWETNMSNKETEKCFTGWWFQPIWKILVKMVHLPQIGLKINNCLKPLPILVLLHSSFFFLALESSASFIFSAPQKLGFATVRCLQTYVPKWATKKTLITFHYTDWFNRDP